MLTLWKHHSEECYHREATCYRCKQPGHISTICSYKPQPNGKRQHPVHDVNEESEEEEEFDAEVAHLGIHRIGAEAIVADHIS